MNVGLFLAITLSEFGQIITATSNDENYGRIEGGGAYEEGDKVTLKAICHDDFWSENYKKYVHLFDGWYDGDTKVCDDITYTYTVGKEDKVLVGKFIRIDFTLVMMVVIALWKK